MFKSFFLSSLFAQPYSYSSWLYHHFCLSPWRGQSGQVLSVQYISMCTHVQYISICMFPLWRCSVDSHKGSITEALCAILYLVFIFSQCFGSIFNALCTLSSYIAFIQYVFIRQGEPILFIMLPDWNQLKTNFSFLLQLSVSDSQQSW